MHSSNKLNIIVGGRATPLSRAQINEVLREVQQFHPHVEFTTICIETVGDKDMKTSLRSLGKTDFFTREIDQMLHNGQCRIAIHSAKDLPDPLTKGLKLIALTKGVDPSDSLVLRMGETIWSLPSGAIIATSSERREESVRCIRPDFIFIDVRGPIAQRLQLLEDHEADGVVVAEAALIRLHLTYLNRIKLPGMPAPWQGQLAIVAREEDEEMEMLFSSICVRSKVSGKKESQMSTNID